MSGPSIGMPASFYKGLSSILPGVSPIMILAFTFDSGTNYKSSDYLEF
jgi:hypothetical protein